LHNKGGGKEEKGDSHDYLQGKEKEMLIKREDRKITK
jgi:hypothetical protein